MIFFLHFVKRNSHDISPKKIKYTILLLISAYRHKTIFFDQHIRFVNKILAQQCENNC